MSAPAASEKPKVIIKWKKKKGGHGHHGGAWKVAFADFMTAMMALFLVLWIVAQSQEVKQAVAYYFRHPTDFEGKPDALLRGNQGLMDNKSGRLDAPPSVVDATQAKSAAAGANEGQTPQSIAAGISPIPGEPGLRPSPVERPEEQDKDEIRTFLDLADDLWKDLGMDASFQRIKDQIQIQTVEDGLVIQLVELPGKPLLEEHSEKFKPVIQKVINTISAKLAQYPKNKMEIDGHGPGFSNDPTQAWLGSAMLADLTRRELQTAGLKPTQITKVSGCADTRPLDVKNAGSSINRRISILVRPRQWKPEHY